MFPKLIFAALGTKSTRVRRNGRIILALQPGSQKQTTDV